MNPLSIAKINIDEQEIEKVVEEKVQQALSDIQAADRLAYTYDELAEITGLSRSGIEKYLLHNKDFLSIRRKVGRKWLFPVEETRAFLKSWLKNQPTD